MKVKINQKMLLLVAVVALFVFYLWSRSISKYSSSSSSISSIMSPVSTSSSETMPSSDSGSSFMPSLDSGSSFMPSSAPGSFMPSSSSGSSAPGSFMPSSSSSSSAPGSFMPSSSSGSSSAPGSYLEGFDSIYGIGVDSDELGYAELDADFSSGVKQPNCSTGSGVGLASSLLPREVAKVENFGDFAPDDILKGQNFLDTRNQIGFPETIGGNIRNGNLQIRADPPNPKQPYVWNNSTIVPDLMQRDLCS
jgi:hypothetical protein